MTTLLRLRDRGVAEAFVGAALQYGAYDLGGRTPGGRKYVDEFFIGAYVGGVEDRTDPDISALFGDLRGLPPTPLVVGTLDIVLEDSLAMATRLRIEWSTLARRLNIAWWLIQVIPTEEGDDDLENHVGEGLDPARAHRPEFGGLEGSPLASPS